MSYETMTRVQHGILTVRVWRASADLSFGPDYEAQQTVLQTRLTGNAMQDAEAIVRRVADLEGVACVEVVDAAGNGGLVWPGGGR